MFKEIETYRDLLKALGELTDVQLAQRLQVIAPSPFSKKELEPVLAIGTIAGMELEGARSCYDNRYHAEDIVLLTDHNPFGENGAIAYEMKFDDDKDERKPATERIAAKLWEMNLLSHSAGDASKVQTLVAELMDQELAKEDQRLLRTKENPIFASSGPTPEAAQWAPKTNVEKQSSDDDEDRLGKADITMLRNRCRDKRTEP
jgi:hypothetical protein